MPGRLFLTTPIADIARFAGVDQTDLPDTKPRRNIQPGQYVIALTSSGFEPMRWGIIPVGRVNARGRPVMETIINARSETVFDKSAFEGVGRAVVIVDGWYEWTGEKRRKTAWRLYRTEPLVFAAITDVWSAPGGREIKQVATVTCEPNEDISPIHHRMGVLLEKEDIKTWLTAEVETASKLMKPWPNGRLTVEEADDVDWSAD